MRTGSDRFFLRRPYVVAACVAAALYVVCPRPCVVHGESMHVALDLGDAAAIRHFHAQWRSDTERFADPSKRWSMEFEGAVLPLIRGDLADAAAQVVVVLPLAVRHAAERGAHHGSDPLAILPGEIEMRVRQRHPRRRDGELGIAVQPPRAALLSGRGASA